MTDLDFLLNETPPHLHETIKRLTQVSPDSNVEKNREMLLQRSIVGLAKYGVTTDNNPLSFTYDSESGFIRVESSGGVQSVAPARRSFAFDRREVDVKVDFWKKNQG